MKVVASLLAEIQEREATDLLSPQQLRLVLLKTMNHLLSKYDNTENSQDITSCIDELQRLYNYLQQSKMITREQLKEVRNDVYRCLNDVAVRLSLLQ